MQKKIFVNIVKCCLFVLIWLFFDIFFCKIQIDYAATNCYRYVLHVWPLFWLTNIRKIIIFANILYKCSLFFFFCNTYVLTKIWIDWWYAVVAAGMIICTSNVWICNIVETYTIMHCFPHVQQNKTYKNDSFNAFCFFLFFIFVFGFKFFN